MGVAQQMLLGRTPPAAGGDLNFVQASGVIGDFGSDLTITFGASTTVGNHIFAAFAIANETSTVSGTGATVDASPVASSGNRAWGLRTPSLGSSSTTRPYTLSSGWSYAGLGIEVAGATPAFDASFVYPDAVFDSSTRTLNITVAQNNSIVLVVATQQVAQAQTLSANLTGVNTSPGAYVFGAWGKFNAGAHALTFTPAGNTQFNSLVAFVWRPT